MHNYLNINTNYYPFGSLLPSRHTVQTSSDYDANGNKVYRYGFNGKESDFEAKNSGGTQYDYGFRIYDPRLGKFLSVDPLTAKFPMLTPYQFASNTPIWAIDLDGLEARVYTDQTIGLPHSFLSVIDDEGVINVYTYGQYGQAGYGVLGRGALVHLKGEDANNYIKHEFDSYPMRVFEVSDKVVDKQKIIDYYAEEMKNNNIPAKSVGEHAPTFVNEENGSSANLYKTYLVTGGNGTSCENCSSVAQDGLKAGGLNIDFIPPVPYFIDWTLKDVSDKTSLVKDVTANEKNAANNNLNTGGVVTIDLPEFKVVSE